MIIDVKKYGLERAYSILREVERGTLYFPEGDYLIPPNFLNLDSHYKCILGEGRGLTKLIVNSPTGNGITIHGNDYVSWNSVKHFSIMRSTQYPISGAAIELNNALYAEIDNVYMEDHNVGIKNLMTPYLRVNKAIYNRTKGADQAFGFKTDYSQVSPSVRYQDCTAIFNGHQGETFGFYANGNNLQDVNYSHCGVEVAQYGFFLAANSPGSPPSNGSNISLNDCYGDGIKVTGVTLRNLINGAYIKGGYTVGLGSGALSISYFIDGCENVSVSGISALGFGNPGYHQGFRVINSRSISLQGNLHGCEYGAILKDSSFCALRGSTFFNRNDNSADIMIFLDNAQRNSISTNTLRGYSSYPILMNAGSNYNRILGNIIDPLITNSIYNAGVGNEIN
jgi:hypothetical protein